MKRPRPGPLDPTRIRAMRGSFGWIPHEFVRRKIPRTLGGPELLLYFFLCAVSDAHGVSFYGEKLLAEHLSLAPRTLAPARRGLIDKGLILYREGVYQVLPLPVSLDAEASRQTGLLARRTPARAIRWDGQAGEPVAPPAEPGRPEVFRRMVHELLEKIDARSGPAK